MPRMHIGWLAVTVIGLSPAGVAGQAGRGSGAEAGAAERREAITQRRLERQERREPGILRERVQGADMSSRRGLDPTQRQALEQRLRQRFGEVVRRQLSLTDDQFRRLGETNRRFEGQRRDLVSRERSARGAIRDELGQANGGDETRVGERMQELLAIQRERLALVEAEDRQLAEFLTPQQRARYFGLQEQLRRRVEEMRRRAMLGEPLPPE